MCRRDMNIAGLNPDEVVDRITRKRQINIHTDDLRRWEKKTGESSSSPRQR